MVDSHKAILYQVWLFDMLYWFWRLCASYVQIYVTIALDISKSINFLLRILEMLYAGAIHIINKWSDWCVFFVYFDLYLYRMWWCIYLYEVFSFKFFNLSFVYLYSLVFLFARNKCGVLICFNKLVLLNKSFNFLVTHSFIS